MPEQDVVAQWKAFSPEQRQSALGKMTPEQKNTLKSKIEASTSVPRGTSNTPMMSAASPEDIARSKRVPVTSQAKTPYQKAENFATGLQKPLKEALPAVAATVGAMYGGIPGAAAGGAAGELISHPEAGAKGAAIEGAEQGALELVGGKIAPKVLSKIAAKASPRAAEILNNYIGLGKANLPKFGRTIQNARDIAQTVLEKVGVKPTLESQRAAIESTRASYEAATQKIVATPGGKLTDVHTTLLNRAVELLKQVEKEGVPHEQIVAIDKNLEAVTDAAKKKLMNPAEIHEMRREIQKQITDWRPDTTNIRMRFLQGVYHDLNDAITRSLPADEARAFRAANKVQSKLITARQAADSTLLKESLKQSPGLVTKAARVVGGAAAGGVAGAVFDSGDRAHGAIEGALLGAAGGGVSNKISSINKPALDVAAQKILGRSAEALAKVSKASPTVVRALQSIRAIQSTPQQ
jgi:uncharacterized protein YcfJ